ncbi:MAG TPA: adenosylcobinamide-GDP ribazoletransferase [Verrucomicrobiae bacterium]|nr:adenosylcobinamide-GDP ribazoletransferase [Verrucomicrobiae bacterium]
MNALRAFAKALRYFSIVPVGAAAPPDAFALGFLPLVGALVGAAAGLAGYAVFAWLHVGWWFVVAWVLAIAFTGAIHLDGFLDACDGLFASVSPARRLEIMRDPHHGTFAIAGMAALSALWLSALASIAPAWLPLAMAFAACTARVAALSNAWVFPYARANGHAAAFAARPNPILAGICLAFAEVLAWWLTPAAMGIPPLAIAGALLAGWWSSRRLGGGLTGDVYGAIVASGETVVLLSLAVLVAR